MNQIVRRVSQTPAVKEDAGVLQERIHHATGIFVSSQLSLDIEPRLHFSWAVQPQYWDTGYTLLVFRSTTGFCSEKHPADLNSHGQLIIETVTNASHDECLPEGSHYFTFVLHKKILLGLSERMSVVRFSETVPSAKVAVGRIKDQIDLQDMLEQHEIGKIEYEARLDEAKLRRIQARKKLAAAEDPQPPKDVSLIADEVAYIDAMVGSLIAKRKKIEELKNDPRFKKLPRSERKAVLDKIEERLDIGELSAKQEMRGT